MRYDDQDRESSNVEDRRGQGGGGFPFPGGFGGSGRRVQIPFPMGRGGGRGGFSITTLIIIGVVLWFLGINPFSILTGGGSGGLPDASQLPQMPKFDRPSTQANKDSGGFRIPTSRDTAGRTPRSDDQLASFTKKVLADTEDVWNRVFKSFGKRYREPQLVLFSGATRTACGMGQSAMGPFYCPLDQKIYVDLAFYEQLKRRFQAPGDFAQAYVIAHEVGHHVQNLVGILPKFNEMRQRVSKQDANELSIRVELQADCFAGLWARYTAQKGLLDEGDVEEALNAATQIGDDAIQRRTQGYVVPESFNHGTSQQRVRWFRVGLTEGNINACDTFNASNL
ncbi:MAG: zinc metallopeptidase [Novosphingobium sp.]|nr:zinc metallopeptidase [Novosphingobium sp.]